ncbi:MAG: ADP-ribosylation factor protein 3 [Cyphobasidiales sp. Tagirdzhanova-0007]|nr:MAG: ADP-ribosylation factor protein 3 [Cyphobasidiales sp. Tagirdzhanova-0007]
MYQLLSGLLSEVTRKDEFSIVILGLDAAGKTTFLERVKTVFSDTPGLPPEKIHATIGQNIGRITLSSSVLQFWDLGGQRDLRSLWPKYYNDCHAVCFIVDSTDSARMEECWTIFDSIVTDRRIEGVPTLVLANKMDQTAAMRIEQIKEIFNKHVDKMNVSEAAVMPISALKGEGVVQAVNWLLIRVQNSRRIQKS